MFFAFMLGIIILVMALALSGPVKTQIDDIRGVDNLNCSSTDISIYDKGTCIVADLTIFHFVGGLIFIAGAVIAAKIIFS